MRLSFFFSISILLLVVGCTNTAKNEPIYFGGQIKNPKNKEITIFKNDIKLASSKLDYDNNFMFILDSLKAGLYQFKHGDEFQYIYLEKKDSLLIRLNTWDFDGSLVFSGKGAQRNNLLIQLFLETEQEERQFYDYFKLEEKYFTAKVDSLVRLKDKRYKEFREKSNTQSSQFNELVTSIMAFSIYGNKEKYPLFYKKYHQSKELPKLTSNFYNHRQITNGVNTDSYTYNNYLWNKINNISYYQLEMDSLKTISYVLLEQISKLVEDESLKNKILKQTYINSLFDSSCSDNNKEATKSIFYRNCSDNQNKKTITELLELINTIKINSKIPEFYLTSVQGKPVSSIDLITKNTVIYFWPKEETRIQNMAKRILFLIDKYPNIQFIGIDGQLNAANWYSLIKGNNLDSTKQFQLTDQNKGIFYTNDFPRAIVIAKNQTVINNFTFISLLNFENILQEFK